MIGVNRDKKPLPTGNSLFDRVIEGGYYYVDKTLFIKDLIDIDATVTLYTRPRRFGKTLNQTMLKCFFEDTAPIGGKDTRALFRGLKIEGAGERYMDYQGKYPVIFLSFKDTKSLDFDGAYDMLVGWIAYEFERHAYAAEKISDDYNRDLFKKLSKNMGSVNDYRRSLRFLCECLENYHGKRPIILIDEYDVPLENAWSRGFYPKILDFIQQLLSIALKDNPHLEFAVMTGCLRISKEGMFTGLNHLKVISVLSKYYSEYFGFSQDEIDAMLRYYGFSDKRQIVEDWYNGYLFGNANVYNPWSSIHVVENWLADVNEKPKPYWVNTSGNFMIREMIDKMNSDAKGGLETLMSGGTISAAVREDVTYDDVYKDTDTLWNFLLFTGYLKKVGEERMEGVKTIMDFAIPNLELQYIYETKVQEWFNNKVKEKDLSVFYNAILSGDVETFQRELSKLLAESISFMDSAENFYHGFMAGVMLNLGGYKVKSNRESGNGRSDLVLLSANGVDSKAVIFELKSVKEFDALPDACQEALKQIEEKNYAAYWNKEGYEDIIKYGIGFYKKRCRVQKRSKES